MALFFGGEGGGVRLGVVFGSFHELDCDSRAVIGVYGCA